MGWFGSYYYVTWYIYFVKKRHDSKLAYTNFLLVEEVLLCLGTYCILINYITLVWSRNLVPLFYPELNYLAIILILVIDRYLDTSRRLSS